MTRTISSVPGGTHCVSAPIPTDESVGYYLSPSRAGASPFVVAIRRSFLHASARVCLGGTPENSPAIYRRVIAPQNPTSPARGERKCFSTRFFRPSGTRHRNASDNPPINRWAIFFRPVGLGNGCARVHSKSRSMYSIPCFFKNTSISSLNVILR